MNISTPKIISTECFDTRMEKSLVYALNGICDSYLHFQDEEIYLNFLNNYLYNHFDKILNDIDCDFSNFGNIDYSDEKKECYLKNRIQERLCNLYAEFDIENSQEELHDMTETFYRSTNHSNFFNNSSQANLCCILILLDEIQNEYSHLIDAYAKHNRQELLQLIKQLEYDIISTNTTINSFIMEPHLGKNFVMYRHYEPTRLLLLMAENIESFFNYSFFVRENKLFENEMGSVFLHLEEALIHYKVNNIKLQTALLFIKNSPQYTSAMQKLADKFLETVIDFLCDSYIYKIYIPSSPFMDMHIAAENRGNANVTTRLQIFFWIENEDAFCLRYDLPHKGMHRLHLNLEEAVNGKEKRTGIPFLLSIPTKKMLLRLCGHEYEHLFFEFNNLIWFKSDFEKKAEYHIRDKEHLKALKKLFKHQSHLTIQLPAQTDADSLDFINELSQYLLHFRVSNLKHKNLKKDTADFLKTMGNMRKIIAYSMAILKIALIDDKEFYDKLQKICTNRSGSTLQELFAKKLYPLL